MQSGTEYAPAQFGSWATQTDLDTRYDAAKPDLVLITLGADDVQFHSIVTSCVENSYEHYFHLADLACVRGNPGDTITDDFLDVFSTKVVASYKTLVEWIQERAQANGVPVPKVVFTTYPDPLPPNGAKCPDTSYLYSRQVRYLASLVTQMNGTITETIKGLDDPNVAVADVSDAYTPQGQNHRWCSRDPWAYGLSIIHVTDPFSIESQAPFHPTPAGRRASPSTSCRCSTAGSSRRDLDVARLTTRWPLGQSSRPHLQPQRHAACRTEGRRGHVRRRSVLHLGRRRHDRRGQRVPDPEVGCRRPGARLARHAEPRRCAGRRPGMSGAGPRRPALHPLPVRRSGAAGQRLRLLPAARQRRDQPGDRGPRRRRLPASWGHRRAADRSEPWHAVDAVADPADAGGADRQGDRRHRLRDGCRLRPTSARPPRPRAPGEWGGGFSAGASAFRAIITFPPTERLQPGESTGLRFRMDAPANPASATDEVAWNSFAHTEFFQSGAAVAQLPATEPIKVGIAIVYGGLTITKTVDDPSGASAGLEFDIQYDCTVVPERGGDPVTVASGTVTVADGASGAVDSVPAGATCAVWEPDARGLVSNVPGPSDGVDDRHRCHGGRRDGGHRQLGATPADDHDDGHPRAPATPPRPPRPPRPQQQRRRRRATSEPAEAAPV